MRTTFRKISDGYLKVVTSAVVAAMVLSDRANAVDSSNGASDMSGGLETSAENAAGALPVLSDIFIGVAYVAAFLFGLSGGVKIKDAVDSKGQQTGYMDGVWRLAIAAILAFLPDAIGMGGATFGFGESGQSAVNEFNN